MQHLKLTLESGFLVVVNIGRGQSTKMQLSLSLQSQCNLLLLENLSRKVRELIHILDLYCLVVEASGTSWLRGVDFGHLECHDAVGSDGAVSDYEDGDGEAI